jgi:hypothetical protein
MASLNYAQLKAGARLFILHSSLGTNGIYTSRCVNQDMNHVYGHIFTSFVFLILNSAIRAGYFKIVVLKIISLSSFFTIVALYNSAILATVNIMHRIKDIICTTSGAILWFIKFGYYDLI